MKCLKGVNGKIIIRNRYVLISRDRFVDALFQQIGEIRIPYKEIVDVRIVRGGILNGYITIVGNNSKLPVSIFSALKNENTVIYRMTKNHEVKKLRKEILENVKNKRGVK